MSSVADIALRKLPPYNEEAEQYVLGACFGSGDAFARALEILALEDFYKTSHRKIFSA
ncbi:MAG TPA: DnaB-like helicase N-terminal domain-containing protein, partial [Desulfobacteria bacterium]|nr:DnaB-like helicase N-terminal domain-containing protein [Desulfobacteria bacterium]